MKKWVLVLAGVLVVLGVSGCLQVGDEIPTESLGAHKASTTIILDEGVYKSLELENYLITVSYLSSNPQTLMFEVDDEKTTRIIAEKYESCLTTGMDCEDDNTDCWDETVWSCHMNCPKSETKIGNISLIQSLENCTQDCGFKTIIKCRKVCTEAARLSSCNYAGICLKDYVVFGVEPYPPSEDWDTTRLKITIAITVGLCGSKEILA